MMSNKVELTGIIVREILKRVDEFFEEHHYEPIGYTKLKGIVGRQAKNAGGFETIIQALIDDHSVKLVTLETGRRFIAPGACDTSNIRPVRFTVEPS